MGVGVSSRGFILKLHPVFYLYNICVFDRLEKDVHPTMINHGSLVFMRQAGPSTLNILSANIFVSSQGYEYNDCFFRGADFDNFPYLGLQRKPRTANVYKPLSKPLDCKKGFNHLMKTNNLGSVAATVRSPLFTPLSGPIDGGASRGGRAFGACGGRHGWLQPETTSDD